MSRLTRDGTAETVSQAQILRERGQGNLHFPWSIDHKQNFSNLTRLILTLATCLIIHTEVLLCVFSILSKKDPSIPDLFVALTNIRTVT